MYIRSLSASAPDGRWEWYESGPPFEFEQRERYAARRKRDRFDRELLLQYLECPGIPALDDMSYRPPSLLQHRRQFDRRTMVLEKRGPMSGKARISAAAASTQGGHYSARGRAPMSARRNTSSGFSMHSATSSEVTHDHPSDDLITSIAACAFPVL